VRKIRKSDVAFMYASKPDKYKAYGATLVVWGGAASREEMEELHRLGVHYQSSMWVLTAGSRALHAREDLRNATVVDFLGERVIVPWLWDHVIEGTPMWWGCTNSPAFRELCRQHVREAMAGGPDGLQIDDHGGTGNSLWAGGCFCEHCMTAFREHLGMGPEFNYRRLIAYHVSTRKEYCEERQSLPLCSEFETFQVKRAAEFIGELRDLGRRTAGHPITFSVNAIMTSAAQLVDSIYTTFTGGETEFRAQTHAPGPGPIFWFKMADAIRRPLCATGCGWDWAYVKETGRTGLVKTWIAQTYAFGHLPMAPHRQWCYTQEKGTHWYAGPTKVFAPLFRFVRENAELFDDYEAARQVMLLHSSRSMRAGKDTALRFCERLAEAEVQFEMVVAGDDWLKGNLSEDVLAGRPKMIVPADVELSPSQRSMVEASCDCIAVPPGGDPAAGVDSWVGLSGLTSTQAVVRVRREPGAPMVVHLLNRDYNPQADAVRVQHDGRLRLSGAFAVGVVARCTAFAPDAGPQELKASRSADEVVVELPPLGFWTILRLERS